MKTLLNRRELKGDLCLRHCKGGDYILVQRISYKGEPHWLYARHVEPQIAKEYPLTLDGRLTSLHFEFFLRPEEMFTEYHSELRVPRFSMIPGYMNTMLYRDFVLSEFYDKLRNWWFTAVHTETGDKIKVNGDGTYTVFIEQKLKTEE